MAPEVYELVAMGMRYWFVFLGVLIAVNCWRWLLADRKAYQATMELLPDAGLVGELVDLYTGEGYPLVREGTLGSGHACDVRVSGLRKRQAAIEFENGKGVKITPLHAGQAILLDGEAIHRHAYALHGTRIAIGPKLFRVRLFAGLEVPDRITAAVSHMKADPAMPATDTAREKDADARMAEEIPSAEVPADADPRAAMASADSASSAHQDTWQFAVPPAWPQTEPHEDPPRPALPKENAPQQRRSFRRGARKQPHED